MRILALTAALALGALTAATTTASADPWKDESGHGRWRYERGDGLRGREAWRERHFERRVYGYYGERPYRRAYRNSYYPAYGYYRGRPERRIVRRYRDVPAYGYYRRRAEPRVVVRYRQYPAYGYYRS
jgi:hypothetical protein